MSKTIISIGRDPRCDIHIDGRWDTVSNEHADIELRNGVLTFFDHSSNGTLINGQRLHNGNVSIYPGDRILLAGTYELPWSDISRYFPTVVRPTVARPVVPEAKPRATVQKPQNIGQPAPPPTGHSRQTDIYAAPGPGKPAPAVPQPPVTPPAGPSYSQAEIDAATRRWNWGAFFCSWIWAVCHRTYWPLFILLVAWIPFVGQVANLVLTVYLGLNGSRIAWTCGKYRDFDHYRRAQRVWAIVGLVVFLVSIASSAVLLYFVLSML